MSDRVVRYDKARGHDPRRLRRSGAVCAVVPQRRDLAFVVRFPTGSVRTSHEQRRPRAIPPLHRPRDASRGWRDGILAYLRSARGQELHPGVGRRLPRVLLGLVEVSQPGERGTVMVIAADKKQARVIYRFAAALLREVPMLKAMISRDTAEAIDLKNGITIEILTASFRTVRGYTLIAALCDEIAFWRSDESANPDSEIIGAIRPAMATIPGAMLLCASSPYARRGALWTAFRKFFGKESPVLVWKADTRTMNPTVPQSIIDEAYENDPASAAAEYGAEFRTDVETFVSREVVEAAVVAGRFELQPVRGTHYVAFADPSGGSSDSMTLAICHREGERVVVDCLRERRSPFSPDGVVFDFVAVARSYAIASIRGDRYAGLWPRERFAVHGVEYVVAEKTKSELYRDLLPLLNSGRIELLDNPRVVSQLVGLERRTARGGRDSVDHPPGAHDDLINAVAGAVVLAFAPQAPVFNSERLLSILRMPPSRQRFGREVFLPSER